MPQPSSEIRANTWRSKYILKNCIGNEKNTLILLLYKVMAIIQTPQVGNQSAYPKILPLSNILMVLINQHKF